MSKRDAYKEIMLFKNKREVKNATASNKGCLLYEQLLPLIEARQTELRELTVKQVIESELLMIKTVNQVDAELCAIIDDPTTGKADKLRAMDIYYKRFGANAPVKQDVRVQKIGVDAKEDEYI